MLILFLIVSLSLGAVAWLEPRRPRPPVEGPSQTLKLAGHKGITGLSVER